MAKILALPPAGHALSGAKMIVAASCGAMIARVPVGSDVFVEHHTLEVVREVGPEWLAKFAFSCA